MTRTGSATGARGEPDALDAVAADYIRLVLAVGRHDGNYVDAFYGPPDWRAEAERGAPIPADQLLGQAQLLLRRLRALPDSDRREFLEKQMVAVETTLRGLLGERMPLAREAALLYDLEPPRHPVAEFEAARARLELLLPGDGDLGGRVQDFRGRFVIPKDRLAAVVDRCLEETRRRTRALVPLPEGEAFRASLVTGKPWNAYNWYQGGFRSLIEVNTDLPIEIHPHLITIAHEGYPGHHTYNALLEDRLVRGRGWPEYEVYPLYSPQSLLAEGTANLAASIVFTADEEWRFVEEEMAPLAGIREGEFRRYREVLEALEPLRHVRGEAARLLLEDGRPADEVKEFLMRHWLVNEERARKAIDFIRTYRSYVFNYTVGEDLVRRYLGAGPERGERFFALLQRPATPSGLLREIESRGGGGRP
jgi:hypothetical protein